jgi:PAS domain S-box-containing protein
MKVAVVNEAYGRLIGRRPEQLIDKNIFEIIPEAEDYYRPILEEVRVSGKPVYLYDTPYAVDADGIKFEGYLNVVYQPYREIDGVLSGVIALCQDVSEQVAARKKIVESEAKYRALFDSMDQGFCVLEIITGDSGQPVDYRFIETNPVFEKQTGLQDAIGKTALGLVPNLEAYWVEQYGKVALTGEAMRFIRESQAMQRWFDVYAFKIGGEESKKIAVLFTDITERKKIEEAVYQSESNLRNMILQSPVAMCILRGSSFVVDVANERILEIWGRSAEEMIGKPVFESLPDAGAQGLEKVMQNVFNSGERFVANELPVRLPRKGALETVYANFVYEPFKGADGAIIGIMAVAIDVTEQVVARQKIEEVVAHRTSELALANQALVASNRDLSRSNVNLGEFAYAASHDLKEPIRKIHFFTDRLKSTLSPQLNDEQARSFDRLETSAKRMSSLIDNLLSFSQVSFHPSVNEDVDLNQLIDVVLEDLDLEIEDKKADITVDGLFTIKGHHRQWQQAFQNLIGNAVKYSKPGTAPIVHISCNKVVGKNAGLQLSSAQQDQSFYCISVKDNGIGFEQEDAERIFNVFTRLHGNSEYKGTGIGLSIVRKVVENHNGYIIAESSPEQGATFKIYLPEIR